MSSDERAVQPPLPPFADYLGIRTLRVSDEEAVLEMRVTADHLNRNGVLHGGAIMALADNAGGTAAFRHLQPGETTTTTESKTNFFRSVSEGEVIRAVSLPLHIGRRTQVWQTSLYRADGKMAAQVTQTQMTIPRSRD